MCSIRVSKSGHVASSTSPVVFRCGRCNLLQQEKKELVKERTKERKELPHKKEIFKKEKELQLKGMKEEGVTD